MCLLYERHDQAQSRMRMGHMKEFTKEELAIIDIVEHGMEGNGLADDEIMKLYAVDWRSRVAAYIRWAGGTMQYEMSNGTAEIHAQIGLNGTPCPKNCKFCSFAIVNDLRHGKLEMPKADVVEYAKIYEDQGANAILLLATASYKFSNVLEMAAAVREAISPDMPLITNTEDITLEQAKQLKAVGVNGAYHAVRMREGEDTEIPVEDRLQTFENLREAGLSISTCVEPVGPEHTPEELTRATRLAIDSGALSAGVGRRISVPGTVIADRGMIQDDRNSMNVAIYRLAAGKHIQPLNCAMSSALSAASGANLAWAEVGTNPRDVQERTENGGQGYDIAYCRDQFEKAGYQVLEGPSQGWML